MRTPLASVNSCNAMTLTVCSAVCKSKGSLAPEGTLRHLAMQQRGRERAYKRLQSRLCNGRLAGSKGAPRQLGSTASRVSTS